jgi:peptidoglycan/LPS O-acetylase OafA/YrhL
MASDPRPEGGRASRPIRALTSIRFLAAFWVVFHHFGAPLVPKGWAHLETLRMRGGAGVSLFFVLSGFILAYNYAGSRTVSLRGFLSARFARIYPVYLVSMLFAFPMFLHISVAERGPSAGTLHSTGQLALCLGLLQSWFPMKALLLNPPGWSLSAEWFFYSVFPFWMNSVRARAFLGSAVFAVPVLWAASLLLMLPLPWIDARIEDCCSTTLPVRLRGFLSDFYPLIRLPEFLVGCSFGILHLRMGGFGKAGATAVGGSLLALGALLFLPRTGFEEIVCSALLAPVFGLILLGLANVGDGGVRWLTRPWLVYLGEASFALYILHEPARAALGWGLDKAGIHIREDLKVCGMMVAAVLLSMAAYSLVESPLRPRVRAFLSGVPRMG